MRLHGENIEKLRRNSYKKFTRDSMELFDIFYFFLFTFHTVEAHISANNLWTVPLSLFVFTCISRWFPSFFYMLQLCEFHTPHSDYSDLYLKTYFIMFYSFYFSLGIGYPCDVVCVLKINVKSRAWLCVCGWLVCFYCNYSHWSLFLYLI